MLEQPPGTHLAQFNVATAVDDLDSPRMAGFMGALDRINELGDASAGFVWRLTGDVGSTDIKLTEDPRFIINLTVWETPEQLRIYAFKSEHKDFFARRREWFLESDEPHLVMWWVPAGHQPTAKEAMERLNDLRQNGESERAFGWKLIRTGRPG